MNRLAPDRRASQRLQDRRSRADPYLGIPRTGHSRPVSAPPRRPRPASPGTPRPRRSCALGLRCGRTLSCLGRSPHWPVLTRPRLAGFQVSTEPAHTSPWRRTPRSQDRWSALTKAGSSRRRWSAASIIATVGERRKLLSAGRPGYIDVAGRCVRLGALEPTPRWLRAKPRWSTLGVRRIRGP